MALKNSYVFSKWSLIKLMVLVSLAMTIPVGMVAVGTKETSEQSGGGFLCGTIKTSTGDTLTLLENTPVSAKEIEKVHVEKMKGAIISPVTERECAINLCGFSSVGIRTPADEGYIGTSSDYGDCELFQSMTTAKEFPYVANFNTSSLSCGCIKKEEDCTYTCDIRSSKIIWKENDCAVLFQEKDCNSCYFPPVYLSNHQNVSTNPSLHFLSMVVRDGCFVEQRAPAFARMVEFHTISQPILHQKEAKPRSEYVTSFLDDPEFYRCLCGVPPQPVPTSPPGNPWVVVYGIAGAMCFVAVIAATVGALIWSYKTAAARDRTENQNFMELTAQFRNVCSAGSLCAAFSTGNDNLPED